MSNPEKLPILIVDHLRTNRLALVRGVEELGHQAVCAESGLEALDKLRQEAFGLVLLEIELPDVDGFQILGAIMDDPILRSVPILITSAGHNLDEVARCIQMGAEDYITLPPNPIFLEARINSCLEKKRLRDQQRQLFRTFTNREVADELLNHGFSLGGVNVTGSALFSDIRGFTTLAERLGPVETIKLLNDLYGLMFEAILSHSGHINQIQGDGVMAIFGAPIERPDHAACAAQTALEMVSRLEKFNASRQEPIQIGIGVASGKMVAGYAGTLERATYTCIGDTVNLAARLESHTKVAGVPILIDEFTRRELPEAMQTTALGNEIFKGKTQAVRIFALQPQ
jgi:class 3 adenylate cyclase